MSGSLLAAGALAGAAAVVAVGRLPAVASARRRRALFPVTGRRLAGAGPLRNAAARTGRIPLPGDGTVPPSRLVRLAPALGGLAAALLLGGVAGLASGLIAAALLVVLTRRIESAPVRRRRERESADLPLAADLLAAALRAGAPVDRAVTAVAEALGGPLGERLDRVGRTLRLGGEPAEAWQHLAAVPAAERLTGAAVRSAVSGAALARALTRLADDLRVDRAVAAEAAARRAGVLIVLPLGLCFLPAFILAGLVPVIVAVLGDVL